MKLLSVIAPNLDAGFAALKRQQPDVVLLDVQLGEEDGLSLARGCTGSRR